MLNRTYSAEEVKTAVETRGISSWSLRSCSMCYTPLRYVFESGQVGFDSSCDCTSFYNGIQLSSYEDVAYVFNMQSKQEVADMLWASFIGSGKSDKELALDSAAL